MLLPISFARGETWYVRPDGGTRYSSKMPKGECDGKTDAPYPGHGKNQHCAFNDVRLMYGDGSYNDGHTFPGFGWVMHGGDTLIIRGSVGTGAAYRIGWASYQKAFSCSGAYPINGLCGNPFSSWIPAPPDGTQDSPTRILGENFANCSADSARTPLRGGASVQAVLNLSGSSHVDVECLDISDFSECDQCTKQDDSTQDGIILSNKTTHLLIKNVRIHGMSANGIVGPTGDDVTLDHVDLVGNHMAGWNTDDGTTGVGHLIVKNYSILWNGCSEEYPIVDKLPYTKCRDDESLGYGDGFGTASKDSPAPGWQIVFDHGVVAYNTQDGIDALHVSGLGSSVTVTNTIAYGNMGQQIKLGASPTVTHNLIVGNCKAMHGDIPGTPKGYNQYLSDFCRANDTAVALMIGPHNPVAYEYNTMFADGQIGVEIEYLGQHVSGDAVAKYDHNIFIGFPDWEHVNPTPVYSNSGLSMFRDPGSTFDSNDTFHPRSDWMCPERAVHETHGSCADPHLPDETWHNYGYPKVGAPGIVKPAAAPSSLVTEPGDGRGAGHSKQILVGVGGLAGASIAAAVFFRSNTKS